MTSASVLVIAVVFAAFVMLLTVSYRDGLQQRLRGNLASGALALHLARGPATTKAVIGSLAAEGISVEIAGVTAGGGTLREAPNTGLLTALTTTRVSGRVRQATLAGSLAGIDRQVHSLEVTEAIGGVIVLALLGALTRVLVLLDRAVTEARASETAMRRFLADASHELRNPVARLHATAERLLRDQPPRPDRDAIEAQLARDSGRLGHLVSDLLNLARLDAQEPQHRQPLDLAELASTAAATTPAADRGAIELIRDGPVPVSGDRGALLRAIRNLLDNGLAVADTVVIEVTPTVDGAAVSVTDNGPGIPVEERERIFEAFVRLAHSPPGGSGLGLAIVRRTVESHHGSVKCEPGTGSGARFTIRLPNP
ncbi:MAG: HAMP domain-containing sensor histidine kinase [Solirubrobacteraceae bacterium]